MLRISLLVLIAVLFSCTLACAQPDIAPAGPADKKVPPVLLTAEQQNRALDILKDARRQTLQLLTPEQQQQMAKMTAQLKGNYEERYFAQTKALDLPADVQTKITAIQEDVKTKMDAIKADAHATAADRQTQLKDLRSSYKQQVQQLLTKDQQKQFRALVAKEFADTAKADKNPLKLTDDQQVKIKAIQDALQTKINALKALPLISKKDVQAQTKTLRDAAEQQIQQLLTPEQLQLQQQLKRFEGGKRFEDALQAITLSTDQATKIADIKSKTMDAVRQVMTTEQQARFDQLSLNKRERFIKQLENQLDKAEKVANK